jgi:hypothetical protein
MFCTCMHVFHGLLLVHSSVIDDTYTRAIDCGRGCRLYLIVHYSSAASIKMY